MSRPDVALIVGVIATAVSFVLVIPQIVRLLRTGRTEGVSASWAAVGVTLNVCWIAYVVAERLWIAIPSVVVAASSFAVALYLLHRKGARIGGGLALSAAILVSCGIIQLGAGWTVLGTVLGLSNAIHFGPSVVAAWRTHTPVGVSPLTWVLAETEGVSWAMYGVLVMTGPIIVFGVSESVLAALILLRLWQTRHRIRAAQA